MDGYHNPTMQRYSVVVSPPDNIIEQVRQLKQQLQSVIGWYGSVNAWAHITFNVFQADAVMLQRWEKYTARFAAQQVSSPLLFDHTDAFPKGAFFLAPDEVSELLLLRMMKDFHQQAPLSATKSMAPHMSIGRRLGAGQLSEARALIREVTIRFVCTDMVLRRFNENRRQYDIYKRFPFGGM